MRLEEATHTIVREVSTVVGATRASIMVVDDAAGVLRTVAARGFGVEGLAPVPVDDDCSVAAKVYREQRTVVYDPAESEDAPGDCGGDRGYRGRAFLSVPICYGAPGSPLRCIGVINLTDRIGGDRFTPGDRKLVAAVANQIGAAVENARLVERDLRQQQHPPRAASWPTTSSSSCSRRRRCCMATPRWRCAASRRNRWAATSTPSPASAAAGWG